MKKTEGKGREVNSLLPIHIFGYTPLPTACTPIHKLSFTWSHTTTPVQLCHSRHNVSRDKQLDEFNVGACINYYYAAVLLWQNQRYESGPYICPVICSVQACSSKKKVSVSVFQGTVNRCANFHPKRQRSRSSDVKKLQKMTERLAGWCKSGLSIILLTCKVSKCCLITTTMAAGADILYFFRQNYFSQRQRFRPTTATQFFRSLVRPLSHSCTLLEPFNGFRCHLAGTLARSTTHCVR